MARPIVVVRRVDCAADIRTVWREVTDTDRLNRLAGMHALSLTAQSGTSAARYSVRTILGGFPVEFEELPFEWKEFEAFATTRKMRAGPVQEASVRFEFKDRGAQSSTVLIRVSIVPRIGLLRPILWLSAVQSADNLVRAIRQMERERPAPATRPGTSTNEGSDNGRAGTHLRALDDARQALQGRVDPELIEHLARFVRNEHDSALSRIRPYELADAWQRDRTEVLVCCLEAVGAGLLDLRWDIICPSCRTAASRVAKLADLPGKGHCHLCELEFAMDLDRAVEATFSPNPSIRSVDAGPYCIGGPARTPHVYAQVLLRQGGHADVPVPAKSGRYKLFARGGAVASVVAEEGATLAIDVKASAVIEPKEIHVAPGGKLLVENDVTSDRHIKLERLEWLDSSASAHEVSLLAPFRRLFSSETLRTGTLLRVARVGLFFSDLTGSTALYTNVGDAAAYRVVHEHFELLQGIIERHQGTVVKTIGDAVMAAFVDEMSGMAACAEVLEAFYRFRHGRPSCEDLWVKLGFFAGPAYVVRANQVLDYFGQSVNIAARLQAKADASELVTESALATRAHESGRLGKLVPVEFFDADLKGLAQPLACARLRLAANAATSVRPPADIARSVAPAKRA